MNRAYKKAVSALLAIGILLSMAPVGMAEGEDRFFLVPVNTGLDLHVGEFLLHEDELYISTDTLEAIGKDAELEYSELVIGGPDRLITRSDGERKDIAVYLYEDKGHFIDAEDGKTYIPYLFAMQELCISTYMGGGNLLIAQPAKQVKYLQNRLSSIRGNDNYGMSSLRDQEILFMNANDLSRFGYLIFNGGKNLQYVSTLLGVTSIECYRKAFREILLPTDLSDHQFHMQSIEVAETLSKADGFLDDILTDEILKKMDSNETLKELLTGNTEGIPETIGAYHGDLIGVFDTVIGTGLNLLQPEDILAHGIFIDNIDKVEEDVVSGLNTLYDNTDVMFEAQLRAGLAAELNEFESGSYAAAVLSEIVEGTAYVGDELLFTTEEWLLKYFGKNTPDARLSNAVAHAGATAISVAGDLLFDTQDKIDATLMVTTNLNISEAAYDSMGALCSYYWSLEWGSGKGEMLQHLRDMTLVYLKACKNAWRACCLEGENNSAEEINIAAIDEEIRYITSFEERDFTVVKDAMATSELLKTKADKADSTTIINITWDATKGDPDISFYSYGTETTLNEDGTAYVTEAGQTVAGITAAEGSATYMIFGGFGVCEMQVARLQNDMSELGVSIYATTRGEDGTSQHCSPDEYLDYGDTRVWYYGLMIDESGTLMPSREYRN